MKYHHFNRRPPAMRPGECCCCNMLCCPTYGCTAGYGSCSGTIVLSCCWCWGWGWWCSCWWWCCWQCYSDLHSIRSLARCHPNAGGSRRCRRCTLCTKRHGTRILPRVKYAGDRRYNLQLLDCTSAAGVYYFRSIHSIL